MARKVTVEMTDDLDGGKADRTVAFALDGTSYEIDLSKKNASALSKAMQPYVSAARRVRATRARAGGRARSRNDLSQVREWAAANGYEVSTRGRIAREVVEAYEAAR